MSHLSVLEPVFDYLASGIVITDTSGAVVYRNKAAAEMYGSQPAGGEPPHAALLARVLRGETLDSADLFLGNLWVRVLGQPLRAADGTQNGAVLILRGAVAPLNVQQVVAERDQARNALREAEQRFRTVVKDSADGFLLLAEDGSIQRSGPPILGYEPEEFVGRKIRYLIHPDDRQAAAAVLKEVRERPGRTVSARLRVLHKDGSWRWVEAKCRNLFHEPVIGTIVVNYRDVTEHTRLEERFHQAQKMETLGTLAGGVAHDFNNLLTIITGYGQLILEDTTFPARYRATVEEIVKAGHHAASLTGQLLAFSRPRAGQAKILDLNNVVSNMEKMLRRVIGEHIELVTSIRPGIGKIKADSGQIEQVILNLAVNARDAMPRGGQLRIETQRAEFTSVAPDNPPPGSYVMLSVGDTGHGMDDEIKDHLFEPFFTTKEKGKGTGLGLTTVYGIVKQGGGHILVWSQPGAGTVFQIYLPCVSDVAEPAPPKPGRRGRRRTETVLLVEDDAAVRVLTRQMLERTGYTVLEAGDGPAALAIAERHQGRLDLLLTDVVMPLMSGGDLVERITSLRPDLKVLYMSGYSDDVIAYHGMSQHPAGMDVLKKPFSTDELVLKLRQVLKGELKRKRRGAVPG